MRTQLALCTALTGVVLALGAAPASAQIDRRTQEMIDSLARRPVEPGVVDDTTRGMVRPGGDSPAPAPSIPTLTPAPAPTLTPAPQVQAPQAPAPSLTPAPAPAPSLAAPTPEPAPAPPVQAPPQLVQPAPIPAPVPVPTPAPSLGQGGTATPPQAFSPTPAPMPVPRPQAPVSVKPGAPMAPVRPATPPPPPPSALTATTAPADVPAISLQVNFATGSAKLEPGAMEDLARLGVALNSPQLQAFRFRIEGHTDRVGDAFANQVLSERRADAVREFLVNRARVAPQRLMVVGLGETQPLVPTPDEVPERRNRRVQILNLGP
ncbi:OmpA family protein [Rhodovarius lipocyclicus]|uniref:OmpA family protein n=1 Tax=Rhodovarius lipocyclicus TaxID=268410 RepID=UPI0013588B43|nr:OmpA family protein [Rhodovarius lipocyclicus]